MRISQRYDYLIKLLVLCIVLGSTLLFTYVKSAAYTENTFASISSPNPNQLRKSIHQPPRRSNISFALDWLQNMRSLGCTTKYESTSWKCTVAAATTRLFMEHERVPNCAFHTVVNRAVLEAPFRALLYLKSFLIVESPKSVLNLWVADVDFKAVQTFLLSSLEGDGTLAHMNRIAAGRIMVRSLKEIPELAQATVIDAALSDLFRFAALRRYGGIYTDFDGVFVRDLGRFCGSTFLTYWDAVYIEPSVPFLNTAVMGCSPGCNFIEEFWSLAWESGNEKNPSKVSEKFHPKHVSRFIAANDGGDRVDAAVIDIQVFDPLWVYHDPNEEKSRYHGPVSLTLDSLESFFGKAVPTEMVERLRSSLDFPMREAFPATIFYHTHHDKSSLNPNSIASISNDWLDRVGPVFNTLYGG